MHLLRAWDSALRIFSWRIEQSRGGRDTWTVTCARLAAVLIYARCSTPSVSPLYLQPRHRVQQVVHLCPRPLRIQRRVRPLPIPSPLLRERRLQLALEHLRHVPAQHGEELVPVERAARRDVQALGRGVRRDDEVAARRKRVPDGACWSARSGRASKGSKHGGGE